MEWLVPMFPSHAQSSDFCFCSQAISSFSMKKWMNQILLHPWLLRTPLLDQAHLPLRGLSSQPLNHSLMEGFFIYGVALPPLVTYLN